MLISLPCPQIIIIQSIVIHYYLIFGSLLLQYLHLHKLQQPQ